MTYLVVLGVGFVGGLTGGALSIGVTAKLLIHRLRKSGLM